MAVVRLADHVICQDFYPTLSNMTNDPLADIDFRSRQSAFDSLESNRRKVKWEIGLRYRPINSQLPLPLPVAQDLIELDSPGKWESMKEEYNVLSLFPAGHIMAMLRPRLSRELSCSKDIPRLKDGDEVITAGLVIRRQRPLAKVVFITLEDEFGHIPLMVMPQVYEPNEHKFKAPFLMVKGRLSRREGTHNVVVNQVKPGTEIEVIIKYEHISSNAMPYFLKMHMVVHISFPHGDSLLSLYGHNPNVLGYVIVSCFSFSVASSIQRNILFLPKLSNFLDYRPGLQA